MPDENGKSVLTLIKRSRNNVTTRNLTKYLVIITF